MDTQCIRGRSQLSTFMKALLDMARPRAALLVAQHLHTVLLVSVRPRAPRHVTQVSSSCFLQQDSLWLKQALTCRSAVFRWGRRWATVEGCPAEAPLRWSSDSRSCRTLKRDPWQFSWHCCGQNLPVDNLPYPLRRRLAAGPVFTVRWLTADLPLATASSFLLQTRPELPRLTHGSGPRRPAAPAHTIHALHSGTGSGRGAHCGSSRVQEGCSGGSRPTSSGPRRGRCADRPGADRSDVKSALVTSRTGCATAGAAATAGILAVRDGQVASHHRCHNETLWQSVLQQEQGQQSVIRIEKHLSLGAVICDILTGLLTHTCTHIHTLADTLLVFVFCTSIGDVVFSVAWFTIARPEQWKWIN